MQCGKLSTAGYSMGIWSEVVKWTVKGSRSKEEKKC